MDEICGEGEYSVVQVKEILENLISFKMRLRLLRRKFVQDQYLGSPSFP
jgi:hypothetical protein